MGIRMGSAHFMYNYQVSLNNAYQKSRERVRTALKNAGFPFPQNRITVNLAPANLRKDGNF